MSQFRLLQQRRFAPFFCTQFLGAFNDNVYKNAVVILIAYSGLESARADALVNLAAGIFILPYFLFSATAGQLADKHEKSRLIRIIKAAEIGIAVLAAVGFVLQSVPLLLGVLFLLGTQATMFGPVKYSILPQHLSDAELVGGNGLVEMGTFVAILIGTVAGGVLVAMRPAGPIIVSAAVLSFATLGWVASRLIPAAPAHAPELRIGYNPWTETRKLLHYARQDRVVLYALLANSWFWFYGALFLAQFPGYARSVLGGNEHVVTIMLAAFSVGIGVGSTLCERMSAGRIELGLCVLGALGLTGFAVDLFFASPARASTASLVPGAVLIGAEAFLRAPASWRILADLVLIGVFGGWFIVPLYALMQHRSSPEHRSRVIAANNVLNALFMVAASIMAIALRAAGLSITELLLLTGVLNAIMLGVLLAAVPEFVARFVIWFPARLLVRLRELGPEPLRRAGAALLLAEQARPLHALLLLTLSPRPVRCVVPGRWLDRAMLGYVLRALGAATSSRGATPRREPAPSDPTELHRARVAEGTRALGAGELVCVFLPTEPNETALLLSELEQAALKQAAPIQSIHWRGLRPPPAHALVPGPWAELLRHVGRRIELRVEPPALPEPSSEPA